MINRSIKIIRQGSYLSVADIFGLISSVGFIAWAGSLSSGDVAMFSMSVIIVNAMASFSVGFSILAQAGFAADKKSLLLSRDVFSRYFFASLFVSGALLIAAILLVFPVVQFSPWGDDAQKGVFGTALFIEILTLPFVFSISIFIPALLVIKKSKYIVFASIFSVSSSLLAFIYITYFEVNIDVVVILAVKLLSTALGTILMVIPLRGYFLIPKAGFIWPLLRDSKNYLLWPSLEQIVVMASIFFWQNISGSVSVLGLAVAALCMRYYEICRRLINGVSKINSLEVANNKRSPLYIKKHVGSSTVAALLLTSPVFLVGLFWPTLIAEFIGNSLPSNDVASALRFFAITYLFDIFLSVVSSSMSVLGAARQVFLIEAVCLALFAICGGVFNAVFFDSIFGIYLSFGAYQVAACVGMILLFRRFWGISLQEEVLKTSQ